MAAIPVTVIVSAAAALGVNLTSGTVSFSGSVAAEASLAMDGTANVNHEVTGGVDAAASLTAAGVRGAEVAGVVAAATALGVSLTAVHDIAARVNGGATLTATPVVDGQGLLVRDAVLTVLGTLDQSCCRLDNVSPCLREAVIAVINATLQTIYAGADRLGYFNRETVTLTYEAGATEGSLGSGVQGIHGPVRLETPRIILREVTDRAQFERYAETFYGNALPDGPRAWYLHAAHTAGGDSVALTLHITPEPAEEVNILVDVIVEAPRHAWADVAQGTPLGLPHKYVEALLLPLVRDWATSHELFSNAELLPQIKEQAELARLTLGLIDPKKPRGPREEALTA